MRFLSLLFVFALMASCKSPTARSPVMQKSGHFFKQSVERNKKIELRQEKRIQAIIAKDTAHDYHTSTNGFWYRYDKKNTVDTLTPHYGDLVFFRYNICTLEGKPIYTFDEIGTRKYIIDKESVFRGLRHALKLLNVHETATFYFPSYQAFGFYGDQKRIARNTPIRVTLSLDSIKINHDPSKQPFKSK